MLNLNADVKYLTIWLTIMKSLNLVKPLLCNLTIEGRLRYKKKNMGKKFTIFVFSALCVGLLALSAQARDNSLEVLEKIDIQRMMKDIVQLCSAQLEGRQAGTFGGRKSADIVQKRLESLGVVPGGNFDNKSMSRSWFQSTSIPITRLRNRANLTFSLPFNNSESIPIHPTLGSDFLPILDSPSVNIMAPVAFVGYGIDDPARGGERL